MPENEGPVTRGRPLLLGRAVAGRAVLQPPVEVELRARAARPGRTGLPEVLAARAQDDALARHADGPPRREGLLVRAQPELLVALEDGDPDVLGAEAEPL